MALALRSASPLRPEIRLAQAMSQYEAILTDNQKTTLRGYKTEGPPNPADVMRLTADIDRDNSNRKSRRCVGPRLTSLLESVQQCASVLDTIIGGSQSIIASSIWGTLKLTLLIASNFASYFDHLSTLLMNVGRTCPRYQEIGVLYPNCKRLQNALCDYFVIVLQLCSKAILFLRKPFFSQLSSTSTRSFHSEFRNIELELRKAAETIRDEARLASLQEQKAEAKESSSFRARANAFSEKASRELIEAKRRRSRKVMSHLLDACSTYNFQAAWKQARKAGTTGWIRAHKDYKQWLQSPASTILWCTGILGSGKTVLSANLVEDTIVSAPKSTFSYFFCKHDEYESLEARLIVGSLVRQLLCCVQPESFEVFDKEKVGLYDVDELLDFLLQLLPETNSGYYVMVDGLDECTDKEVECLVQAFKKLLVSKHVFRIYLSSRPEVYRSHSDTINPRYNVSMTDGCSEIEEYIESSLYGRLESKSLSVGDPAIILTIRDALLKGSQGMFLWVVFQLDAVCSEATDENILRALANLPKDLPETFNRILRKIDQKSAESPELFSRIFETVAAARRPLFLEELRHALSVVPGRISKDSRKLINDIQSTIDCCGSLLYVDEEDLSVRFAHHSIKQYLVSTPTDSSVHIYHMNLAAAEAKMGAICVTYLNSQLASTHVKKINADRKSQIIDVPSAVIRGTLPRAVANKLAQKLLKDRPRTKYDAYAQLKATLYMSEESTNDSVPEYAFLNYAQNNWLTHTKGVLPSDPSYTMWYRLVRGERDDIHLPWDPESWSDFGDKLLHWSICHCHNALLRTILGELKEQRRPVRMMRVFILMMNNAINFEGLEKYYNLLLDEAIENSQLEVATAFFEKPVDSCVRENVVKKALSTAIQNGNKAMIEVLLSRNYAATINVLARESMTWSALQHDQMAISQLLLENWRDIDIQNLLRKTVQINHEPALNLLICQSTFDINQTDQDGRTVLWWAAWYCNDKMVEILISQSAVDILRADNLGRTPLLIATKNGHTGMVKLLIYHPRIEPNSRDREGRTALWWAVRNGDEKIVKLLLMHDQIDANMEDWRGQTPLAVAVKYASEGIVKTLMEYPGTDPNLWDKEERTPLWCAVGHEREEMVRLLLTHERTDVNIKDRHGRTPLSEAMRLQYHSIVDLLRKQENVQFDPEDDDFRHYRSIGGKMAMTMIPGLSH